jgi:F-type H+-transporting ATPase subunit epsilon
MMHVQIFLPTEVFYQEDTIRKIVAEGMEGYFALLPRHIDYVSVLVPGIMTLEHANGTTDYIAVDRGTLVKKGENVAVSVRNGVRGESIEELSIVVEDQFKKVDDMEKKARAILAGLEFNMLKRFSELKHD